MKTNEQLTFSGKPDFKSVHQDKTTFKHLHETYFKRLYLFSRQFIHSPQEAEEIVDDVFLTIWEKRKKLNEIENLNAYLYIITRNLAVNHLQKKATRNSQITDSMIQNQIDLVDTQTPESQLLYNELNEELQNEINRLPLQCRKVFKLVKEDGLRYKEVAQILNIAVNTVDAHVARAMKTLRTQLSKKFQEPEAKIINIAEWSVLLLFLKFFHFLLV